MVRPSIYPQRKAILFAECPYNYFVRFGLGINELQKAEFSAVNVGSLVHASLDRIFKKGKGHFST